MKVKQEGAKWSCLCEEKLWTAASGHWECSPRKLNMQVPASGSDPLSC